MVPIEAVEQNPNLDIATLFFYTVFGSNTAKRIMQGAIALAIFGNSKMSGSCNAQLRILTNATVVVMTFTASRVKQEIAKEGILPFSLIFATGKTTPIAWLQSRFSRKRANTNASEDGIENLPNPLEQSPMAALVLHWLSSLLLIAVTAGLTTATAYSFLVELYSYVLVVFIGFWTATGLLYCKFVRRDWVASFKPLGGSIAAIIYW